MSFCLSWDHHKLEQYDNNIPALNLSLSQTNSDADLRKANNIIRTYNEALTQNLQNTQEKKFVRDNLSLKSNSRKNNITNVSQKKTKAPRSIRFVRKTFPTTNGENSNAKVFSVLNVSSVSLTESETSLLSKGLNFCPSPRDVNERAIREDTRAFFRRLRLKGHFSRKYSSSDVGDKYQTYKT